MDEEHDTTNNEPQDRHWGWVGGYLMIFSVITIGISSWLAGRYRGGDEPPHPVVVTLCSYILGLSISSLFFFIGLVNAYPEKKVSGMGLWMALVAWCMWVAPSIGITVLYKGSYDCHGSDKGLFPHCDQLVALQAFSWIMVVWISFIPMLTEDKLHKTPEVAPEQRRREDVEEEGRGDLELGRLPRDGVNEPSVERSVLGPPENPGMGAIPENMGSIPGPPERNAQQNA